MRLDDFRLGNFRYYVAILIFNFASIVDKATFINQSAANLAALFSSGRNLPGSLKITGAEAEISLRPEPVF